LRSLFTRADALCEWDDVAKQFDLGHRSNCAFNAAATAREARKAVDTHFVAAVGRADRKKMSGAHAALEARRAPSASARQSLQLARGKQPNERAKAEEWLLLALLVFR
jgi:hypothetical protein